MRRAIAKSLRELAEWYRSRASQRAMVATWMRVMGDRWEDLATGKRVDPTAIAEEGARMQRTAHVLDRWADRISP